MLVAPPATPTLRDQYTLPFLCEIGEQVASLLVADDGADRQLDDNISPVFAGAIGAHAVLAPARAPVALELEVIERVEPLRSDNVDGTAAAAIAAGGAAFGDEFLSAKGDAAVPAVTSFDVDGRLIDEHSSVYPDLSDGSPVAQTQ